MKYFIVFTLLLLISSVKADETIVNAPQPTIGNGVVTPFRASPSIITSGNAGFDINGNNLNSKYKKQIFEPKK
jgi:hypothetical protein